MAELVVRLSFDQALSHAASRYDNDREFRHGCRCQARQCQERDLRDADVVAQSMREMIKRRGRKREELLSK